MGAWLAALVLIAAGTARAEEPVACPEVAPRDAEVVRRLAWIEARLDSVEVDTRRWWSGFVALQSLLVGVNTVLLFSAERDEERYDPAVSLLGSTVGLVTLFAFYPPVLGAGDALRALPRRTADERLAALRAAEARLRHSASASRDLTNEISVAISVLYTEAAALTLLFLGDTSAAFLQAGGGIVVGLGRVLLHPAGAIHAWDAYLARHPDAACEPIPPRERAPSVALLPSATRGGLGIGLTLAF